MQLYENERQRYYSFYQMSNRLDANHLECVKQFRIRYNMADNSTSTVDLKILNNKVSNSPPQYLELHVGYFESIRHVETNLPPQY